MTIYRSIDYRDTLSDDKYIDTFFISWHVSLTIKLLNITKNWQLCQNTVYIFKELTEDSISLCASNQIVSLKDIVIRILSWIFCIITPLVIGILFLPINPTVIKSPEWKMHWSLLTLKRKCRCISETIIFMHVLLTQPATKRADVAPINDSSATCLWDWDDNGQCFYSFGSIVNVWFHIICLQITAEVTHGESITGWMSWPNLLILLVLINLFYCAKFKMVSSCYGADVRMSKLY